jgi:hypothetical protein
MSMTKYGTSQDQIAKTASGDGPWSNVDPKADTEILHAPAPKKKDKPASTDSAKKE